MGLFYKSILFRYRDLVSPKIMAADRLACSEIAAKVA